MDFCKDRVIVLSQREEGKGKILIRFGGEGCVKVGLSVWATGRDGANL